MRAKLLALAMMLLINNVCAVEIVENFKGITTSYPYPPKAYWIHNYNGAPDSLVSESAPPSDASNFTDENYAQIANLDGSYYYYANAETHYFIFKIPTSSAIEVRWYGHANDDNDYVYFYAYNWTGSSWEQLGSFYGSSWGWMNATLSEVHISQNGYVHVAFVGVITGIFDTAAEFPTDYVELVVNVSEPLIPVCVDVVSSSIRDWDGIFDTDAVSVTVRATSSGSPVYWYDNFSLEAEWQEGKAKIPESSFSVSQQNATLSGKPIDGGVTDKWRVNFAVSAGYAIVDGVAYKPDASCGRKVFAENVAITPGSYNITLVGRMYYAGGADWVRVNWYVDENSVLKPYPIPVVQKFTGNRASVTIWKYGLDDYCTDPDCHTEGIYEDNGYEPDTDWDGACIAVGDTTPMCNRDPEKACYGDPQGPHPGLHNCVYFSGYRVGPFIQMNIPDHALGWLAAAVVDNYGTLDNFMRSTTYNQHEGPEDILLGLNTEYALTYGIANIIGQDPKGGLGVVGFVGLIADSQHVVGLMFGHRYGIHPFVMVVTTVPEYPSLNDVNGWRNYMSMWLNYLLNNTAYVIKTVGEELWAWNLRYPTQDIVDLNRAFNDFIVDFLPYTREVLWLVVSCGPTVNHPFITATFVQFKDTFHLARMISENSTLRDKFGKVVAESVAQVPNILGPPDGSTGLNYLLSKRSELDYSEKLSFADKTLRLIDQLTEVVITILKEIPQMEYDTSNIGWRGNWIAGHDTE